MIKIKESALKLTGLKKFTPKSDNKNVITFNSTIEYEGYRRQRTSSVSVSTAYDKAIRLAEPIDNSRDAGATKVDVKLKSSLVEISDNGHGISPSILKKTLQKQGAQIKTQNDKIGRYGFGMKDTAMLLGATLMEIYTNYENEIHIANYDVVTGKVHISTVVNGKLNGMTVNLDKLPKQGTVVKYHLPVQDIGRDFFNTNTVKMIREDLEYIYHPLNGKMTIVVNDITLDLNKTIAGKHLMSKTLNFDNDVFKFDFYILDKTASGIWNGMETVIEGERVLSFGGDLDNIYKVNFAKGKFKGILSVPKTMNVENVTPSINKDRLLISNRTLRGKMGDIIDEAYKLFQQAEKEEEESKISALDNQIVNILTMFVSNNVQFYGGSGGGNGSKKSKDSTEIEAMVEGVETGEKKVTNPKGNPDTLKQNLKKIQNINIQPMSLGVDAEPYYFEYNNEQNNAAIILNTDSYIYQSIKIREKKKEFSEYYVVIASDFQEELSNLMINKETPAYKQIFRQNMNAMAGKSMTAISKTQEL